MYVTVVPTDSIFICGPCKPHQNTLHKLIKTKVWTTCCWQDGLITPSLHELYCLNRIGSTINQTRCQSFMVQLFCSLAQLKNSNQFCCLNNTGSTKKFVRLLTKFRFFFFCLLPNPEVWKHDLLTSLPPGEKEPRQSYAEKKSLVWWGRQIPDPLYMESTVNFYPSLLAKKKTRKKWPCTTSSFVEGCSG